MSQEFAILKLRRANLSCSWITADVHSKQKTPENQLRIHLHHFGVADLLIFSSAFVLIPYLSQNCEVHFEDCNLTQVLLQVNTWVQMGFACGI